MTILIPCFNEATVIEEKVRNCLSLRTDGADIEVLVVDDYSTDDTFATAQAKGARVVRNQEARGKWGAIATGAAAAQHEVLCITDADVLIEKHALLRALRPLDDPRVGAVCGVRRMMTKGADRAHTNADSLYDVVRKAMVVFCDALAQGVVEALDRAREREPVAGDLWRGELAGWVRALVGMR